MVLKIIQSDITTLTTDVIVNAANTQLLHGGGVCGAIFRTAGASELQKACDKLAPIKTGEAVITSAFNLPSKYIIHTAGPIYRDGKQKEEEFLRACYRNSLYLAKAKDCKSIAFPLIASGIYGYPRQEAKEVAKSEIQKFLLENEMDIYLIVFDE